MQDSRRQLTRWRDCWSLVVVAVTALPALWAVFQLLPTFDDWTYLASPYFGRLADVLVPAGDYWRPFDAVIGYVLGLRPEWFPALNHIIVLTGHVVCTFLIFAICGQLHFGRLAQNVGTLFYYLSPGMLGTVLSVDSINQTYSALWGLLGLWIYLRRTDKWRYVWLVVCCLLATFSKENGIMWLAVIPLLSLIFGRIDRHTFWTDAAIAAATVMVYAVVRLSLPNSGLYVNEAYFEPTLYTKLEDVGTFFGLLFIPTDYVSVVPQWGRNLPVAIVTLLVGAPFLLYIFFSRPRLWTERRFWGLVACLLVIVLPHLLTMFTVMHAYAGLSMAALLVAYAVWRLPSRRWVPLLFALYVASSLFIDGHHWQAARESGLMARRMGREAIRQIGEPVDSVFSITIREPYKGYSSFRVLPSDAFGWGIAAQNETRYHWPDEWHDTCLHVDNSQAIRQIADSATRAGYKRVLLFRGERITTLR